VTHHRWFLPDVPDLLAMLQAQATVTVSGMDAFAAWAAGDARQGEVVRTSEHHADTLKTQLILALREAFVTPLEPEDLFVLSHGIDTILNQAKDTVGEAEVMGRPPDGAIMRMATVLARATHALAEAVRALADGGDPFPAAQAAIKGQRRLEHVYRREMAALLELDDLRREIAMRELYRRCSRIGDAVVDVAERIQYAMVKQG
jgi:uncharacterized protein Yka (UPF0111/DUF47 family)